MLLNIGRFESFEEFLINLLAIVLAMLLSLSVHECSHAYMAYKLGDPTAKNMGRMTLDPTKHIDPIGALAFLFAGIGWAKPVPVNSRNLKHFRRDDFLISIAGPVSNIILSFVFFAIFWVLQIVFHVQEPIVLYILQTIITINIMLALFNILPIPPLDGYHVFTSIFVKKTYGVVRVIERYGFILLLVFLFINFRTHFLSSIVNVVWEGYEAFFGLFV